MTECVKMKDDLRALAMTFGPPGWEAKVSEILAGLIAPFVDEVRSDSLGNLIATRRSRDPGSLMLSAHMDQPGLIVTDATKEGLLRFGLAGTLRATSLAGQWVVNGRGAEGVVVVDDGVEGKDLAPGKMAIDVGAESRDGLPGRSAATGDAFSFAPNFRELGDRVVSPALENRAGCALLVEVARRLAGGGPTVHYVFTVQGAVAPRGARSAAYGLEPDFALTVDTTAAKGPGRSTTEIELGKGPALRLCDGFYVAPSFVRDFVERVAAEEKIACQLEVLPRNASFTEAETIQRTRGGILAASLGIPLAHAETPTAMLVLRDLAAAADLVTAMVQRLPAALPGRS